MRTKPEPGVRKPAEDRRREIADAALRVIASQGLGRFTALAIAREVGVTDAALFRHFPSKEAIVDAAIDRVEELLFEGFPPAAEDPIERLGAFFARRVAVLTANPGISSLVATDELAKAGSVAAQRRVDGFRQRSQGFVRSCLGEAEGRGLLAPEVGVEEAAILVVGALLALAHARLGVARGAAPAVAARTWELLESLLRGPRGRARSAGGRPPRIDGRQSGGERP